MYLVTTMFGSILPQHFYALNIFTNICHYVQQMVLNNIFYICEIWIEPSKFGKQKT